MPKRTGDFNAWHLEKLSDPTIAANYLNKVFVESRHLFLDALGDVIQARQVSSFAKQVGVTRESLYRSFSAKDGNPTWSTLLSVLDALGVEWPGLQPIGGAPPNLEPPTSTGTLLAGTKKRRGRQRRRSGTNCTQLALQFSSNVATMTAVANVATPVATVEARVSAIERSWLDDFLAPNGTQERESLPGFMLRQQQQGSAIAIPSYAL